MLLEQFNAAPAREVRELLKPCLDVPRWIEEITAARPFASLDALLATARGAADPLTSAELEGALSHHPRIGEKASGHSAEASMSRSEQAGVDQRDPETVVALTQGNRAYEEKFGRVFLIRAAGRSTEEMLTALQERLGHTPEQEEPIVAEQLREIAVLRLEQRLSPEEHERMSVSHVTTHILDTAAGKPAAGVAVELYARDGEAWSQIGTGTTDADGRVKDLGPERLESGSYRLQFATGAYFAGIGQETFFPEVSLTFTVDENEAHYHVPLLLSPFAFSTYRGS